MKSRHVVIVSAVLLLVSASVFALSLRQAATASGRDVRIGQSTIHEGAPSIAQLESLAEEGPTLVAGRTPEEVASLISNWVDGQLSQRGWLHVRELVDQEGLGLGTLPDSSPIPEDYVFESWYFIDKSGLVTAAVTKMYDLEGREVQATVFEDLTWTNLTFGLTEVGEPFRPMLDHDVSRIVTSIGRGGGISGFQTTETLRGERAVLEITTYDDFDAPFALSGVPGNVDRIINRSVFDILSGEAISFERILRSPDPEGTERVVSSVSVQVIERVDVPPPDVLSLFKEAPK